jgi:hypothetical protein
MTFTAIISALIGFYYGWTLERLNAASRDRASFERGYSVGLLYAHTHLFSKS